MSVLAAKPKLYNEIDFKMKFSASLIFVVDISGSMAEILQDGTGRTRLQGVKDAVKEICNTIMNDDFLGHMALLAFDTQNHLIQDFISAKQLASYYSKVNSLSPAGGTAIYPAVILGNELLLKHISSLPEPKPMFYALVLLTDGGDNASPASAKASCKKVDEFAKSNGGELKRIVLSLDGSAKNVADNLDATFVQKAPNVPLANPILEPLKNGYQKAMRVAAEEQVEEAKTVVENVKAECKEEYENAKQELDQCAKMIVIEDNNLAKQIQEVNISVSKEQENIIILENELESKEIDLETTIMDQQMAEMDVNTTKADLDVVSSDSKLSNVKHTEKIASTGGRSANTVTKTEYQKAQEAHSEAKKRVQYLQNQKKQREANIQKVQVKIEETRENITRLLAEFNDLSTQKCITAELRTKIEEEIERLETDYANVCQKLKTYEGTLQNAFGLIEVNPKEAAKMSFTIQNQILNDELITTFSSRIKGALHTVLEVCKSKLVSLRNFFDAKIHSFLSRK